MMTSSPEIPQAVADVTECMPFMEALASERMALLSHFCNTAMETFLGRALRGGPWEASEAVVINTSHFGPGSIPPGSVNQLAGVLALAALQRGSDQ
jgi:hypothetical protein